MKLSETQKNYSLKVKATNQLKKSPQKVFDFLCLQSYSEGTWKQTRCLKHHASPDQIYPNPAGLLKALKLGYASRHGGPEVSWNLWAVLSLLDLVWGGGTIFLNLFIYCFGE